MSMASCDSLILPEVGRFRSAMMLTYLFRSARLGPTSRQPVDAVSSEGGEEHRYENNKDQLAQRQAG